MTYGQLFMKLNPDVKVVENGTCVWIYFDSVNHDTFRAEWWNKKIPDEALKEQEPRVMSLAEASKADVCWLEWRKRGRKPVACRVIIRCNNVGDKVAWVYRFFEEPTVYSMRKYGKDWRCWTSRPTEEQRRAVKWNEAL